MSTAGQPPVPGALANEAAPSDELSARAMPGVFTTGSTLRHVVVMMATASVGLLAVFFVDFLSLFYISQLGDPALTAGVGYATLVLFLAISFNVGLMIAVTALVATPLGAGRREEARARAGSTLVLMTLTGLVVSLVLLASLPWLLDLVGATGTARDVATRFLWITLPANALMALGMGLSSVLRAVGDARRAMWVTLAGGLVTAALDPLFIFGLEMGPDGAALATAISRFVFVGVGFHAAVRVHDLIARPAYARILSDVPAMARIAGPAILTNIATPVANTFLVAIMARFGDAAVAATAIVDRLVPVAFCGLFALSGAVGPILGQNWGAGRYDRMRGALRDSLLVNVVYVLVVWAVLALSRGLIVAAFDVEGQTADLVTFFCLISGLIWLGVGALFVANAAFNNLGFAVYSTLFNWGRATLGTVPFALAGAMLYGPPGVFAGTIVGAAIFGLGSVVVAFRVVSQLEERGVAGT